jgi:hypothetical protein
MVFGESETVKIPKHISILGSPESLTWKIGMTKNPRFSKPTQVQSIIFDRSQWTKEKARAWLKKHKKKIPTVDVTSQYYRFRQFHPSKYKKGTYRTIPFGSGSTGIKAIIAVPTTERNPETRHTSFYSREFYLACNGTLTTLFLIDGQFASEIEDSEVKGGSSIGDAYCLWSGFQPNAFYRFDLPDYDLKKRGTAIRICYQSDKWDGNLTHYYHDFETPTSIWCNRYSDATIWAIRHANGAKIVSAEGILG